MVYNFSQIPGDKGTGREASKVWNVPQSVKHHSELVEMIKRPRET